MSQNEQVNQAAQRQKENNTVKNAKGKSMTQWQGRQGDVFIQRLSDDADFPAAAKEVKPDAGRTILAYGEVTGHAHALPSRAKLFRMDAEPNSGVSAPAYLVIDGLPATLKHEEHAPVKLAPGKYKVSIQREYSPEAIRNVAD